MGLSPGFQRVRSPAPLPGAQKPQFCMKDPICRAHALGSGFPRGGALVIQLRRRTMSGATTIIGVLMMGMLTSAAFGQDPEKPTTAEAWYKRAYDRRHNNDFDGAIADAGEAMEDFGAAVRISPKFSRAYGDRGDTYRQMGKVDLALADYDRALEIDKKYFWFCEARGDILRSQGKLDGAAADYRSALETAKDDAVRNRLQKKLAAVTNSAKQ